MKETLTKLLTVKSLVTFGLLGAMTYLTVKQSTQISPEFFASVVSAVITYYFTRKESGGSV